MCGKNKSERLKIDALHAHPMYLPRRSIVSVNESFLPPSMAADVDYCDLLLLLLLLMVSIKRENSCDDQTRHNRSDVRSNTAATAVERSRSFRVQTAHMCDNRFSV